MPEELDAGELSGAWIHSHEEDAGDRMVFRPAGYDFPPARAPRQELDLGAGGELLRGIPGPDDRRERQAGRWQLDGRELTLETPGAPPEKFDVETAGKDRLVVKKRS